MGTGAFGSSSLDKLRALPAAQLLLSAMKAAKIRFAPNIDGYNLPETDDQLARQAINEAFVAGYRAVLWVAVGLALASSLSAALLIRPETKPAQRAR